MKFYPKFFLIIPIFIWFFFRIRLFFIFRKFKKNKNSFSEEKRYKWVRKYSKFICWLFSISKKIDISFWSDKKIISITKIDTVFKPLVFISKNNFDYKIPISIVFDETDFISIPVFLKKFYLLIDCFFVTLEKFDFKLEKKIIEKIKIPRAIFYFSKEIKLEMIIKFLKISKETFTKIFCIVFLKKNFKIKKILKNKEIILSDFNIFSKKIKKEFYK